ncbi:uncharacterized protein LOC135695413 [Rhopilema esculentum]|uniref:uncharacterized protein LOC135695413 n=1 Tax=Rhopilema esculentum TaxID=499914 RepID=UPI0031D94389
MDATRILTITRNIENLSVPVKSSTGLKYTAVALAKTLVCLGTNTGSTYIFENETLKLIKFIASKGGSIQILKFSKDEKLLAIVDSIGIVTCLEVNEEKCEISVVKEIEDHKGAKITCLCWDDDSARLFVGDERGIVTAFIVAAFKMPAGKFLSKSSIEVVVKGESPIVQLDYSKLKLLVSTTNRTLLCLTDKSKYQQIGSKPRDGKFGSCFLQYVNGEFPVIYAARPGSRLWEVDFHGQVLATHQFKYLLAVPPKKIHGLRENKDFISEENWDKPQAVPFPKLIPICNRYVVTWSHLGLYILDPSLGKIAGWYDEIKGIKDISCNQENIYIICNDGQVFEVAYLSVKDCLKNLIDISEHTQAAKVALHSRDEILKNVESFLSIDFEAVQEKIQESDESAAKEELHNALEDFIRQLHARHFEVRAEIQERLNRIPIVDESWTPCDSGVEDNDDVKSNQSEVISETSSRLSFTRLPHVDVDRVLRKATRAVVNKVLSSGFMKKALNEVLDEDLPRSLRTRNKTSNLVTRQSPVQVDGNKSFLEEESPQSTSEGLHQTEADTEGKTEEAIIDMGNTEMKMFQAAMDDENSPITQDKRPNGSNNRRRRKAKIVTVDFASPEKDDIFKIATYETVNKSHARRLLSSDSANSYSPLADIKRLSSAPHDVRSLDFDVESAAKSTQIPAQESTEMAEPHPFSRENIMEKAKKLVRKVMQPGVPVPFDVKTENNKASDETLVAGRDHLNCLLVSEDAMKIIPKFVDVTAVCRNKLRDSRVLFNSKTVKKILQDWAEKLNDTVKEFSYAMAENIKKKNTKHILTKSDTEFLLMRTREEFFQNLGAAFSEVSNLAVLCYEAGIFPTSCSDLETLEASLIENETTFEEIRKKVNEILNQDDSKIQRPDVDKELKKDKESDKVTLLSLAKSSDEKQLDKLFFISDEEVKNYLGDDDNSNLLQENSDDTSQMFDKQFGGPLLEDFDQDALTEASHDSIYDNSQGQVLSVEALENPFETRNKFDTGHLHDAPSVVEKNRNSGTVQQDEPSHLEPGSPDGDRQFSEGAKNTQEKSIKPKLSDDAFETQQNSKGNKAHVCFESNEPHSGLSSSSKNQIIHNQETELAKSIPRTSSFRDYVEIAVPRKIHFFDEELEWILCTSENPSTCESCREDFCRACFVLRYSPLLDLTKIRTVLNWKQGCRWRTWIAYLIHLEDTVPPQELKSAIADEDFGKTARMMHDSTSIEQFLSCVRGLLPSSAGLVFDICTEKHINPWEVCLIYMMNPNDVGVSKDFLGYVSTIKRMRPSSNALDDTTVAMTLLYCALKETSAKSNIKMRYCGCGVAREGSHWLPWKEKGFIDNVLMNAVNSNDCGIVCRMFELCRKYGYWVGCIKVLRHLGQHKQVFEVMSQLGDFRLLDDYVKAETFSIQDDDLKHLCNLKYHIRDGPHKCRPAVPDFTRTITDESLARLLVRELGPKEALKMLKYFKEEFVPSSQFYYACLQISEKELEQRQLILKMMESLNSLSFNENKSMLQTQIEELKNRELSGDLPSDEALVMEDSYSTDLQSSNHWGVSLNISSSHCPSCTLPLCIHGASTNAGLVVFDCGHTFHKQCIPEESCIICYYKLDKFIQ